MKKYFGTNVEMVMIHSSQRFNTQVFGSETLVNESILKFNEPQADQRVYTIGHFVEDRMNQ